MLILSRLAVTGFMVSLGWLMAGTQESPEPIIQYFNKPAVEYVKKTVIKLVNRYIPPTINDYIPLLVASAALGATGGILVYRYSQKGYQPTRPKSPKGDLLLKKEQIFVEADITFEEEDEDGWFDKDKPRTIA